MIGNALKITAQCKMFKVKTFRTAIDFSILFQFSWLWNKKNKIAVIHVIRILNPIERKSTLIDSHRMYTGQLWDIIASISIICSTVNKFKGSFTNYEIVSKPFLYVCDMKIRVIFSHMDVFVKKINMKRTK